MKSWLRQWCLGLVIGLAAGTPARAEVEWEDFRRLQARVTAAEESIEVFRQSVQRLETEIRHLRQENEALRRALQDRDKLDFATPEQLARVVEQVREVDNKRVQDNGVVIEALARLEKLVTAPPPAPPQPKVPEKPIGLEPKPGPDGAVAEQGWVHTVGRGQSVGSILDAYRREYGLKTTLEDVRKANPNIRNLNVIQPGQEIVIPAIR